MTLSLSLSHRFDGFALDLALEAGPGITALFGRSGAGKSTVINAVGGLLHPDRGRVVIDGEVLLDTEDGIYVPPHKRRLGTVFQDARLFPHLSVAQNLMFGARYAPRGSSGPSQRDVVALLGLETLLDRAPATLSGGQKQRVALGRALLSHPRMLLMDEPLASLDGPRKQEILPFLERLRDGPLGLPILYVSHAVDEIARLADTLVLIQNGKVQAQGPLFDVMADPAAVPLLGVREAGAVIEALPTRDPAAAMSRLVAYEVSDVLLEGGAVLHRAAWAAGVVDRVRLYVAPVVLGPTGVRGMPAGRFSFVALAGRRTRCLGEDVLLEADVQRFD